MKKIILFVVILLTFTIVSYNLGYRNGCAKVIGKWEKTDINDRYLETHCYGDRTMWSDDVARNLEKK